MAAGRRRAHFRVVGRLDRASGVQEGKVTIEVAPGGSSAMFVVRPIRRHRTYELNLNDVADIVVARVMRFELAEKKKAKALARKQRRR